MEKLEKTEYIKDVRYYEMELVNDREGDPSNEFKLIED